MSKSYFNIREALEIGTDKIVDQYKKATPGEDVIDPADKGEYDNEGEMAKTQLRGILADADHMIEMFENDQNLPEWVQNKITKAADYLNSAHRYMMNKDESVEEARKYRTPTQAEIDADRKKDRAGKSRPSMSYKSAKKSIYKNMMGGLKEEDLQELDAKTQKKFSAGAKAIKAYAQKNGGIDKKDFMEVSKLLDQISRINILQAGQLITRLNRLVDGMDTDVRERIYVELEKVGLVESVELDESKQKNWIVTVTKPINKLKKGMKVVVPARNTAEAIKKALKRMGENPAAIGSGHVDVKLDESVDLSEKLEVSDGMAKWIEDFQKSDAPQFKGKDKNERKEMAVAAYLAAKRKNKDVEESSKAYGKSQRTMMDKEKNARISSKDKDTLGKIAAMMAKEKGKRK